MVHHTWRLSPDRWAGGGVGSGAVVQVEGDAGVGVLVAASKVEVLVWYGRSTAGDRDLDARGIDLNNPSVLSNNFTGALSSWRTYTEHHEHCLRCRKHLPHAALYFILN